jgi:hypothetical protein
MKDELTYLILVMAVLDMAAVESVPFIQEVEVADIQAAVPAEYQAVAVAAEAM